MAISRELIVLFEEFLDAIDIIGLECYMGFNANDKDGEIQFFTSDGFASDKIQVTREMLMNFDWVYTVSDKWGESVGKNYPKSLFNKSDFDHWMSGQTYQGER